MKRILWTISSVLAALGIAAALLISLNLQPMAVTEGLLADQARAIQFPVIPADRQLQQVKATKELAAEAAPAPAEQKAE